MFFMTIADEEIAKLFVGAPPTPAEIARVRFSYAVEELNEYVGAGDYAACRKIVEVLPGLLAIAMATDAQSVPSSAESYLVLPSR